MVAVTLEHCQVKMKKMHRKLGILERHFLKQRCRMSGRSRALGKDFKPSSDKKVKSYLNACVLHALLILSEQMLHGWTDTDEALRNGAL